MTKQELIKSRSRLKESQLGTREAKHRLAQAMKVSNRADQEYSDNIFGWDAKGNRVPIPMSRVLNG